MHRFIMIEILKHTLDESNIIDHIDNNPLNNKRNNLRIVTHAENCRNQIKQKNTSSQYIGVSFNKPCNKWAVRLVINKINLNATYSNEHHAGYQYNLWCEKYNLTTNNLNNVDDNELLDFIPYKPLAKNGNTPKGIRLLKNNKYKVFLNSKYLGTYESLDEAIQVRLDNLKEIENNKLNELLTVPIKKDENGYCIIQLYNSNKDTIAEVIVDEDDYHHLIQFSWHLTRGYVSSKKLGSLHRYVMNYDGEAIIDHINNNKLDNRKENLRIVSRQQNSQNKSSSKNSSSKYIGVSKNSNKWSAYITIDGVKKYIGVYENEKDAAMARDEYTKKYFGEYGNLNIE